MEHIPNIYPTYSFHISSIYPAYTLALFCIYQKTKYSTFSTIMNPHRLNWLDNVDSPRTFPLAIPLLSPYYRPTSIPPNLAIPCIYLTYTQHIAYIYTTYSLHIPCIYLTYSLHIPCIYLATIFYLPKEQFVFKLSLINPELSILNFELREF